MQLPLLVFEEYVEKFQKKLASLKKQSVRSRGSKGRPMDDESEFTLSPVEAEEGDGMKSMGIGSFLQKFDDVLPKQEQEKFGFLVEAHYRQVIQFLPTEGRMPNSPKVLVQGVRQTEESMVMLEFLETFFSFAALGKEMGLPARDFSHLIVRICKDWFAKDALVKQMEQLGSLHEAFGLLYSLARYVDAGYAKRIELTVFRKYQTASSYLQFMHQMTQSKHALLKTGMWKVEKDMWDDDLTIILQKKAIRLIMPDFEQEETEEYDGFRLIAPSDIPTIDLFYEESTQHSLDRLKAILKTCPSDLWNMRRFGVLLAGESGCGKSEYVLQMCRELGYKCMSVTQISSKWVGETEKAILRILEVDYPRMMKENDNKVVLFLDEIDQILGKKTEVTTHSSFHTNAGVSQMLKSLDRFKGIIIGSLNVIDENRLESAGIRRFDTLVNFSLPSRAARKSIWASREGFWQGNDALLERLSGFELSGSDIHSICSRGFFLQFAGEAFAEESLMELIAEQEVLAAKTRYQKSAGSTIGFQKLAS